MSHIVEILGLVGSVALPLFNIPLIYKMIKRKSSQDMSLVWVIGVWVCIVMMTPSGFTSDDVVWRTFSYFNITLFTCVMIVAVKYRNGHESNNTR